MVWADFCILGIIVLSALVSLWRGFMKEAISLVTWIMAFWVAIGFSDLLAIRLQSWIETPSLRLIVAFTTLFLITLLIGAMVNHFVSLAVQKTGLSGTDRMIGAFFGLARGVVLVAVLVLLGILFQLPRDKWWRESALIPYMQPVAMWMSSFLPEDVARDIEFQ